MAITKVHPNDTRLWSYQAIPVDFINDTDVVLGEKELASTRVYLTGPVIVDHISVLGTQSVVPIAVVDTGTTGQNLTASTTFTGAATNRVTNMALASNPSYVVQGEPTDTTNQLRLHITTAGVGQATTLRERTDNVATITTAAPHGLTVGDVIWVKSLGSAGYNGQVTVNGVPSTTTFTYPNVGADEVSTADTAGRIGANSAIVHVPVFYY